MQEVTDPVSIVSERFLNGSRLRVPVGSEMEEIGLEFDPRLLT